MLTRQQSRAWRLLTDKQLDMVSLLFGGGKGGGKSVLFCLWVDEWCRWLKEFFDLQPSSKPPLPVGFIGRKQGVDFRHTTLETFKRIIPPDHYRIREQDQEIIIDEAVKVYYGGLDDQEKINKFNSAEFAFIGIDQGEETERVDVDVLQGTLRLKYNELIPPYKQLYTANPADCWLKEDFIDNKKPNHYFIPALHADNPHLPSSYVNTLRSAFQYNKALLAAYLDGDWYSLQAENSLLSAKMLNDLKDVKLWAKDLKRIIVCDPSLGGDECVIYFTENYSVKDMEILHERDTMKVAGQMVVMGKRYRTNNYALDIIGIGQGIGDRLREMDERNNVQFINSAEKMDPMLSMGVNLRAAMAWHFMQLVIDRKIPFPEDEELRTQLLALKFKVVNSNGKVLLLPKEEVKKRLGRSPDRADAYIMGCWAIERTSPVKEKDAWRDDPYPKEIGSGATSAMTA